MIREKSAAKLRQMQQKIYFVTGKGGVGKSTFAASLALKLSHSGLKTILVELGDQSYFQDYFSLKKEVGFEPVSVTKNFDLALFTGADCLKEYALHLLKIERIYKLFFENPISKSLVNVAPALKELAILGKITSAIRKHGPPLKYDRIVVDGYASGHFMTLMTAPNAMATAVPFGPMGEQSRGIHNVLTDSQYCHYFIVSLPEELPMKETAELKKSLHKELGIEAQVVMNKMLSPLLTPDDRVFGNTDFETDLKNRLKEEAKFREKSLPYVFDQDPQQVLEILADSIGAWAT